MGRVARLVQRYAEQLVPSRPAARSTPARPTDAPDPARVGICCSGGGVRSASYCLGALQVLREEGVLTRATYLSAVSGGAYIASAFAQADARRPQGDPVPPYAPGSQEEQHLRNHSSYMAPDAAGKALLLARIVAGAGWHLLLVALLALAVAWPAAWVYGALSDQLAGAREGTVLHLLWLWTAIPALVLAVGLAFNVEVWEADRRRPFADRASVVCVGLAAVLALVLVVVPQTVLLARAIGDVPLTGWADGLVAGGDSREGADRAAGLLAALGGGAAVVAVAGALSTFVSRRRRILLRLAAFVAGPLLLLAPVLLVVDLGAVEGFGWEWLGLWLVPVALLALVEWGGDLTQWSLHPFYRRRLSSAFSVQRSADDDAAVPAAQEMTWTQLAAHERTGRLPRLLVCAAANVTKPGATPPGRAAVPFVFTTRNVGVPGRRRPLDEYAPYGRPLTVPAAVAMSGAAVSPLMGKKTIRAVRVLMALMNVRLGVWLPNPAHEPLPAARARPHLIFKEMLGLAKLDDPYLYVSDGGHFDNLGLVELLRRGCTTVVCLDGGGDPPGSFRALGEAVALSRSELQVDVAIDPTPIEPGADGLARQAHVLGTLAFRTSPTGQGLPGDATGRIVYCRAAVTADAPWDVRDLARRDRRFPFHSTMDQLFTDEKFEGYRALGAHAARQAMREWREQTARAKVRDVLRTQAVRRRCLSEAGLLELVRDDLRAAGLTSLGPLLDEMASEDEAAHRPPLVLLVQDADPPADDVLARLQPVFRYYAPLSDGR